MARGAHPVTGWPDARHCGFEFEGPALEYADVATYADARRGYRSDRLRRSPLHAGRVYVDHRRPRQPHTLLAHDGFRRGGRDRRRPPQHRGGVSIDRFFLAMTRWRQGQREAGRTEL